MVSKRILKVWQSFAGAQRAWALGIVFALVFSPQMAGALPGEVLSHLKISSTSGSLTGPLANDDRFGIAVTDLGDLDGDGIPDIAVGADSDDDGAPDSGAVYILFLDLDGSVLAEQKISAASGGFVGPSNLFGTQFGARLDLLGDLNGDGRPELAVGAPFGGAGIGQGAVWILSLNPDGTVFAQQEISAGVGGFTGPLANGDQFAPVARLGDVDGDGVVDLAVGVPGNDNFGLNTGRVWILFLNPDGTVKAQNLLARQGPFQSDDNYGDGVEGLGDVDGDGVPDLIVSIPNYDAGPTNVGSLEIVFLNSDGTDKSFQRIGPGSGGFPVFIDPNDHLGMQAARLGDLDGDGVVDIAVGAYGDDDAGSSRGAVWVVFLNSDGSIKDVQKISDLDGNFTASLSDSDFFGFGVAGIGDVNGDGIVELAATAYGDDDGGAGRGAVYILGLDGSPLVCGDGVLDPGETCDDGGTLPGDGCSAICQIESYDLRIDRFDVASVSHPISYVEGTDTLTAEIELEVSLDVGEAPLPVDVRIDLVAYTYFGESCAQAGAPFPCTTAGVSGSFEFPTQTIPAGHLDSRPDYPGAPLGVYLSSLQLTGAINQDGSNESFGDWRRAHAQQGNHYRFRVTLDPANLIPETPTQAEANNIVNDPTQYDSLPLSGNLYFGSQTTQIVSATLVPGGAPCNPGEVSIQTITVDWAPSDNGNWPPVEVVRTPLPSQSCSPLNVVGEGPGFDLVAAFNAPTPVHSGTLGGLDVEITGSILIPGPSGGAYPGTTDITLPEGHSLHAVESGSALPAPRGLRTVEFVAPSGPVADFGTMLLTPPASLVPGFLNVAGLPISILYSTFAVEEPVANAAIATARYVHALPYQITDHRSLANTGVRSNDRRYQGFDFSGSGNTLTLDGAGVDANLPFLASPPGAQAPTHFPRTEMTWASFTLPIVDGQVDAGPIYSRFDRYAFRQSAGCVDCPADTAPGPEFLVDPTVAQGVSSDGAAFARTASLGSEDPVWGPYDQNASKFIFERPGEAAAAGIFLMPGFRIPSSGGDAGPSGAPASVVGSLMGMRGATDIGGSLFPAATHRLGSTEAARGNHFMAGITVGPEFYRGSSFGQPEAGVGTLLGGNILSVGFGGLPNPVYEDITTNVGVKYILRQGGVTGVFNTLTAPNPAIYGYTMSFDRFAFRQVSNTLDPNTWIDGSVQVRGPADFEIVFQSLDLLCTGNVGEGLVVRESCDGSDSNQNGIPDENCNERLLAWRTPFELLSMEFVPPQGSGICDPGNRELEVGSVVDVVALEHEIGLTSRWSPLGVASDSRVSGKTEHLFDDPQMAESEAFLMNLGSTVDLAIQDDMSSGWFRFHDASIGLPFWDALTVGARMQNQSETVQMPTAVGHELNDAFLDDTAIDTTAAAGLMGQSSELDATYTWGATGFSISLPVSYETTLPGDSRRFVGHQVSESLIVLDVSAGTNFISPSETKISFGASSNFTELNFSSLPLNIDLSDPASMLQLDNFLGGNFIQDIAGNLAGSVNGMNGIVGNNLDGFIEDGIFGAIADEASALVSDPFEALATPLAQVQGIPGQLVEQVALELDDLTSGLLDPLTPMASNRLDVLLATVPTLLYNAKMNNGNLSAIELAIGEVDRVLETLDAVQNGVGGLDSEIGQARDNIRGAGNDLLASIGGSTLNAQSAASGILTLVDDAVGLGICRMDNPVIEQIREVGDAVRDVQNVLKSIDLNSIGEAMSTFAEVDLSSVAQAETEIQNLAKDIADGITQAIGTVESAVGCGGGSLPYGTFGSDLEDFNTDLQNALSSIGTDLPLALDTLLGAAGVPTDLGKLGLVSDALADAQGSVETYRGRLEDMRGALEAALSAAPNYEFPSGSIPEIASWFNGTLAQGPTNAIDLLKNTLTAGVDVAIDQAAFHATTGLAINMSDLSHPTGADVENLVTDLLMNDGLIEQADGIVGFALTTLIDKSNGIQLLVFDQINNLVRKVIAEQDGVLAELLENEKSTVAGDTDDWNMPTAGIDGWALIGGDDLQQMHVGFKLSVPGQEESDTFSLDVALDVTRWTANGKDVGCATVDATSRIDAIISAYNLPFRLGASEANIRKVYFGFTLQENGGAIYPVQGFGGLAVDGALDFQVVKVIDPAFVFGAGDVEVYIGASAMASFDATSISVAFLIGKICNNDPLLTIDPQAGEFIDFPEAPGQGFAGGYVRGSASTTIINYGCPLQLGAAVDVGNWVFVGPPVVAGGIMGGGLFGKAACIVSIRGQLTLLIGISDAIASFGGEMFIAGGLGICSPSEWTSVPKSRDDDIFCATIDATIGSSATVDLEALFDGEGSGAIDFQVEEPDFGAIH